MLVQLEGSTEVLSAGLHMGEGEPENLFLKHITPSQEAEKGYGERLDRLRIALGVSIHGIYFMSGEERLTLLPEAQPYLNPSGGLLL